MKIAIRWIINVVALIAAVLLIPGIYVEESSAWVAVGVMAIILGLVNTFIRPILQFLSCGCIVATLGLFLFVVNGLTLWLSAYIAYNWFDIGFRIDGFWPALWGGIVISVVSFILSMFVSDDNELGQR